MRWWHHLHDYFLPHERNEYRPHVFRVASVAVLAVCMLVLELGFLAQIKLVFPNTGFLASVLPGALATLTNDARASAGIAGVTRSAKLDEAAQLAAADMAAKGYFAHVSPDGKTPWYWLDQAGYRYSFAGENLAVNFTDTQALEDAWLASPTHRANIMKAAYTQVGFGTADGMYEGQETTFVVEFFATPLASSSPERSLRPVEVAAKPETARNTATSTGIILGTETPLQSSTTTSLALAQPATDAAAPPMTPSVPARPTSLVTRMLLSPLSTMESVLAGLFALVALIAVAGVLRHRRVPHPQMLIGSATLLALTLGLLALNPILSGAVHLPASDSLSAAATLSE